MNLAVDEFLNLVEINKPSEACSVAKEYLKKTKHQAEKNELLLCLLRSALPSAEYDFKSPCMMSVAIKILKINRGIDLTTDIMDERGKTPLHYASILGATKIVRSLLNHNHPINISDRDKNYTAAHFSVIHNHPNCIKVLSMKNADFCLQDIHGNTPLHHAVRENNFKAVKILLDHTLKQLPQERDSFINSHNKSKQTPLDIALIRKNYSIGDLLVANKANLNTVTFCQKQGELVGTLKQLYEGSHLNLVLCVLDDVIGINYIDLQYPTWWAQDYDANIEDYEEVIVDHIVPESILNLISHRHQSDIQKTILRLFYLFNALQNKQTIEPHLFTPNLLDLLGPWMRRKVMKRIRFDKLFEDWALQTNDPNRPDGIGQTMLHIAAKYNEQNVVKTLLNHVSIEKGLKDKNNQTPFDVAHPDCAPLFN